MFLESIRSYNWCYECFSSWTGRDNELKASISKAESEQYAPFFAYFVSQFHNSTTSSHLMIQILSFILRKIHKELQIRKVQQQPAVCFAKASHPFSLSLFTITPLEWITLFPFTAVRKFKVTAIHFKRECWPLFVVDDKKRAFISSAKSHKGCSTIAIEFLVTFLA